MLFLLLIVKKYEDGLFDELDGYICVGIKKR